MRAGPDNELHLTYCTNIHPANGLAELLAKLEHVCPELKRRVAPHERFGIGLRLSGRESRELLVGDQPDALNRFLDRNDMYVFTINGFPHGSFHGRPVKARVHAPDWRTRERVAYTLRLVEIIARLLPQGQQGSISTSPLTYGHWIDHSDDAAWEAMTRNVVLVAAELARLRADAGMTVRLAIEPEPFALLASTGDLVRWFERWLLPVGGAMLAEELGVSTSQAEDLLRKHVTACVDTCHAAVAGEHPVRLFERLEAAGIGVGKVQVSCALEAALPTDRQLRANVIGQLRRFANSPYLHQVSACCRSTGAVTSYPDLPQALAAAAATNAGACTPADWRVHVHVPLFIPESGDLRSTQADTRAALRHAVSAGTTRHLEIETYTWDVLPDGFRRDLVDSVAHEYEWVLDAIA